MSDAARAKQLIAELGGVSDLWASKVTEAQGIVDQIAEQTAALRDEVKRLRITCDAHITVIGDKEREIAALRALLTRSVIGDKEREIAALRALLTRYIGAGEWKELLRLDDEARVLLADAEGRPSP